MDGANAGFESIRQSNLYCTSCAAVNGRSSRSFHLYTHPHTSRHKLWLNLLKWLAWWRRNAKANLYPNDNPHPWGHNPSTITDSQTSNNQNFWLDAHTGHQSGLDVRG